MSTTELLEIQDFTPLITGLHKCFQFFETLIYNDLYPFLGMFFHVLWNLRHLSRYSTYIHFSLYCNKNILFKTILLSLNLILMTFLRNCVFFPNVLQSRRQGRILETPEMLVNIARHLICLWDLGFVQVERWWEGPAWRFPAACDEQTFRMSAPLACFLLSFKLAWDSQRRPLSYHLYSHRLEGN